MASDDSSSEEEVELFESNSTASTDSADVELADASAFGAEHQTKAQRIREYEADGGSSCLRGDAWIVVVVVALVWIAASAAYMTLSPATPAALATPTQDTFSRSTPTAGADTWRALGLDAARFAAISQVVLLPGAAADELVVSFTVEEPRTARDARSCAAPPSAPGETFLVQWAQRAVGEVRTARAAHIGCVVSADSGSFLWHYYAAALPGLAANAEYDYVVGQEGGAAAPFKQRLRAPGGDVVLVTGDTGEEGRAVVLAEAAKALEARGASLLVHVGDMAYATNDGTCWGLHLQVLPECAWQCHDEAQCHGAARGKDRVFKIWDDFFALATPVLSRVAVVTTMGNHDNDVHWFYKFQAASLIGDAPPARLAGPARDRLAAVRALPVGRPALEQQRAVSAALAEPQFFSVDAGRLHVVSIQSEDNAINAYERATNDSALTPLEQQRFDAHFGAQSPQLRWLEADLAAVDRARTPWVLLLTHRPWVSTSRHHPNCRSDGDWYKCAFRETYAPLLQRLGVDLVLNGHSHHYARTLPVALGDAGPQGAQLRRARDGERAPVHVIIGVGGMRLEGGFVSSPDWMAARSADKFGFATMQVRDAASARWEFFAASSAGAAMADSADMTR